MNKVFIIGRLTKDPEVRATSTGKKVASFTVAVSDGKGKDGQEITQFFNCTAWEKTAELLELYVKKGHRLAIVGRLQNRSWDKPDGTKGYATDIVVTEMEMMTSKQEAESLGHSSIGEDEGIKTAKKPVAKKDSSEDEELPEIDIEKLNIQMPF